MTTFNIVGAAPDGKLRVRSTDAAIDGTVTRPSLSGPYFDNDVTVETSEGTASKSGASWELGQTVETDSSSESGTVLYNATWLGLQRWAPRHDPAKPKKVQIGTVEVTYNEDGTATVEGTDGSFTGGDRTWNLADIAGDKSAFIRAKADYDWTQRTPFPPKAQHTPNVQYVGAPNVFLDRDPALTPYFGRPEARRLPDGKYEEKSSRFSWLKASWTEGELALRDRDGAVTDEQQGQWGSATVGWTENVADVSASEGSVDSAAVGAKQRLRIRVPDVYTQLTLGESYRDQDAQGFAYPGFGVETDGHVFINAKKSAAESMMRLQSMGDLTLQTPENFAAGGQKKAVLASNAGTIVAGGGGVAIFGGAGLPWSDNQVCDGTGPTSPPWISNLATSASNYSTMWAGIDAAIALTTTTVTAKDTAKAVKAGAAGSLAAAAGAAGGLIGGLISAYGLAGGLVGDPLPSLGGTTVHGSTGLILGSGATAGLYSLLGTCIASPASVGVLSLNASVIGLSNTEVKGQNTSVAGWGELNLIGGTTTVAARDGSGFLKLNGSKIFIGPASPTEGGRQPATTHVQTVATSMVVIETKPSGDWDPAIHTPGITLRTHGHLDLKSKQKTTIESHEAKEIEVLLDQHNKIHMKDGETTMLVNDSMIRLKKGEGVTVCRGTSGGILASDSEVTVGFGSNMLTIKKNGTHSLNGRNLDLKGSTIKLG